MNAAEARVMLDKAETAGLKHMIPFTWLFVPAAVRMRELIDKGYVGKVFHVEARYLAGHMVDPSVSVGWRTDAAHAGSGSLGDTGCHIIHFVRAVTGAEFRSVCASAKIFHEQRAGEGGKTQKVEVEDSAMIIGELDGNIQASLHSSRFAAGRDNLVEVEVSGSKGMLAFHLEVKGNDWFCGKLYGTPAGPQKYPRTMPLPKRLTTKYAHIKETHPFARYIFADLCRVFVEGVTKGAPISPSFYDGWRVQQVMDAALASSRQRRWIDIVD